MVEYSSSNVMRRGGLPPPTPPTPLPGYEFFIADLLLYNTLPCKYELILGAEKVQKNEALTAMQACNQCVSAAGWGSNHLVDTLQPSPHFPLSVNMTKQTVALLQTGLVRRRPLAQSSAIDLPSRSSARSCVAPRLVLCHSSPFSAPSCQVAVIPCPSHAVVCRPLAATHLDNNSLVRPAARLRRPSLVRPVARLHQSSAAQFFKYAHNFI
jgi:hypothetical protein